MEAKKIYKKSYSEGRRREIVGLILNCGGLTNMGLRLYWRKGDDYKNKSQIIATLRNEGIIKERKIKYASENQIRLFTLDQFETKSKNYISCFENGTYAVYKNFYDTYKSQLHKETQRKYRIGVSVNANTMMYLSGVKCDAISMYKMFDSRLAKKEQNERMEKGAVYYVPNVFPLNKWGIKAASKSVGAMYYPNGDVYAVYICGKSRPMWQEEFEFPHWDKTIAVTANRVGVDSTEYNLDRRSRKALFIADNECARKMIEENRRRTGPKQEYIVLPSMYHSGLYHVTFNEEGIKMLALMNKANWQENLLKKVLGKLYGTAYATNGISHDASDGEKMILCYCIPDLERFHNFLNNAIGYNDKSKFEIICFDAQYKFVKQVAEDYCTIKTVAIDDYIDIGEIHYDF